MNTVNSDKNKNPQENNKVLKNEEILKKKNKFLDEAIELAESEDFRGIEEYPGYDEVEIVERKPRPSTSCSPISIPDTDGRVDLTCKRTRVRSIITDSIILIDDDSAPVKSACSQAVISLSDDDEVPISRSLTRERKRPRPKRKPTVDIQIDLLDSDEDADIIIAGETPGVMQRPGVKRVAPSIPKIPEEKEEGGVINCPICLDGYNHIKDDGRKVLSTPCGHVFCDACLKLSLKQSKLCPNCRKTVNIKKCHTLFLG